MKRRSKLGLLATLVLCSLYVVAQARTLNHESQLKKLQLPAGFSIQVYSQLNARFGQPRMMSFDQNGNLYVALATTNKVVMIPDSNKDGIAETPIEVARNLNAPNSLTFVGNDMLIANQDSIVKLTQVNGIWSLPRPFITNLPSGGHTLKTIRLGPDGYLYLNVGSSCNVCVEDDPMRATILRYTLDGQPAGQITTLGRHTQSAVWAKGLRNSQGFAWHPVTAEFFATNEGADNRSDRKNGPVNDDLPPEHLNKIKPGQHYGWPHCWGNPSNLNSMTADPNFAADQDFCLSATPPAITFTSHSTPIGLSFLHKSQFPSAYQSDAIVALHGSWNRKDPSGYALVRVKFKNNLPIAVEPFVTGWLEGLSAWGRPVDVAVGPDGALYVSDDRTGYIYKITYQASPT
ncbi:MAG TPA: PQQ-dependent sugar dehydrogenase [Methylophilus sp.]